MVAIMAVVIGGGALAVVHAQTESVIYSFAGPTSDGSSPYARLAMDGAGNLFGTTQYGPQGPGGTVFELVKSSSGWTEKILHSFTPYVTTDGYQPLADLVMDSSGNIYGTTSLGGANNDGVVFELVNSSGTYTEQILYSFGATSTDGVEPMAGLLMDTAGNLYGTTQGGGAYVPSGSVEGGTVFELKKSASGYSEVILHSFANTSPADLSDPDGDLITDSNGDLFGTTSGGIGTGGVFELAKSQSGYAYSVLYAFNGGVGSSDPQGPAAGLVMDSAGNLYGTAPGGGANSCNGFASCGVVFELSKSSTGTYSEVLLYSFAGVAAGDGYAPYSQLVMDAAGNLYGTTSEGGQAFGTNGASGIGTVFELVKSSGGYTEKILHDFVVPSTGVDGAIPMAGLIMDPSGNFYGTTSEGGPNTTFNGGASGYGTVFELSSGSAPTASLSPGSLTFAGQAVGTSSTAQNVTLTNSSNTSLSITGITVTGTDASDFSQTNTCGTSVAANGTCTISVTFKPTATGTRTASVSIADNASDSPQTVSLTGTGTGAVVSLAPSAGLTFASQTVGTTSSGQDITLTNSGNATLNITGITITGANAGDFSETNNCGSSVAASAFCNISVTFTPTASGTRTASVSIADDASGSPQSVSLSGTGAAVTAPAVTLSPTSLTFASQTVGTSSAAQSIMLTNSGNAALSINGITITGANAGDYTQTNTCGTSVAANANCTISVTFTPTAAGSRTASVSIADNASGSPQSVALTGTGAAAAQGDFTVSATPSSLTLTAGSSVTSTLTVTPVNGFNSAVSFACSGLPSLSTCTFSPTTVTPNGAAATTQLSISTTASTTSMLQDPALPRPMGSKTAFALAGLFVLFLPLRRVRKLGLHLLSILALVVVMSVLAGCGGSSHSTTTNPGTPSGTYTVTVTATSGSGSSALSHTATISLTVQ